MRYSAEYDKIETEIRELEAEIGNLEREIESRSFEIKNNISQRIEDLESEIYELENIRFSLSSLFSYLRAKLALYNKTILIQDLRLNPQKEINKLLREEYSEFQNLNNRYAYLKSNKNEEIKRRLQPLSENLEKINKSKVPMNIKVQLESLR
ncbi:MAG: hypothetical protein ACOX7X_03300 [Methanosarcina flavescens]|uniref:Uncharacterized protein n=1 Tax=Methanosarcina flavescens TaxID=1715806 RepID=A0A660HSE0_9EURY|nr:hypothetical protein [Methanosarcina flavescens]AYK15221.1 hypothetical protein AOB57_008475 [Methanosarcina flavescens]NLK31995.1 hypothetical protein [Methanosarcina flavescens]